MSDDFELFQQLQEVIDALVTAGKTDDEIKEEVEEAIRRARDDM